MTETLILSLAIFAVAVLYSSVGHAGASGYLAVMALLSVAPETMKPTALVLNLLVGTVATIRFARAGHGSLAALWPFAVTSVPLAALGGAMELPLHWFQVLVGLVLLVAAVPLIRGGGGGKEGALPPGRDGAGKAESSGESKPPRLAWALFSGAGIGLLAGLTGTGGGIFLSPVLLFAGWADTRRTAGITAPFVLINSAAGLAGNLSSTRFLPGELLFWLPLALLGALLGSELGARRIAPRTFRRLLGVVLVVAGVKLLALQAGFAG